VRLGEALGHDLAGREGVCPRLEDHEDPRQPGHRLGADVVEEGDAVEQVLLQWDGDQLLDLARGQPQGLRLDLHGRRREVGEHLDGHVSELPGTDDDHRSGGRCHEQS
jgi:hypothetical protein